MKKIAFALIAGAAFAGAAQAQDLNVDNAPRWYVGVGASTADHQYSSSAVTNNEDYTTSGKVFGGYEFNNTYGVEVGYTDFRSSDFTYNTGKGPVNGSADGKAYYVAGKANLPLNNWLAAYGKLGIQNTERSATGFGSSHDTGVYAAVGLQYNINKNVALTAEYERYGKDTKFGAQPDVWTIGARYSF
jgi:opacity protein-like surface antigen